MDGSPQVVRFDATTLWHFDAAEWAPSTASFASHRDPRGARGICSESDRLPSGCKSAALCQQQTYAVQQGRARVAMIYSITSSARASSVGGTSRPSALAVLRLI